MLLEVLRSDEHAFRPDHAIVPGHGGSDCLLGRAGWGNHDVGAHRAHIEADLVFGVLTRRHIDHRAPLRAIEFAVAHQQADLARRRVEVTLGDAHVDRAAPTEFTRDFQDLITRYAWGEIWTRPGLDRRTRSAITLTVMVARGHLEELALHVRAARRNGLSEDEIKEVLLHCAIYCGVPDANTAFRIAQGVLAELDDD